MVDLLTISQTSLHNKQVMQRRRILDRVVSIVKMIGKRVTSYRGTGSLEAVSTLCDEKVDRGIFLETVLLLAKYDNILKCHLENVIKKCLQNKSDKHKHNRANRNTFVSKTTINSIIAIISKLMKEEISNSVREAGIYSVQIDSVQDITSTDKCLVILRFVRENVEERLLAVVDSHSATGADLCNLLKKVLQKQNIDVSKCISDSTDGASNMSESIMGLQLFLKKNLLVTFSHGAMPTFSTWFCDVTTTNHTSIPLFGIVQKVGVFFRESYLRMDMWKEQMRQRYGYDIQSRLNLIEATRWWSKHECLRKIFGTFEDGSSGMFCDVIEVLYCASTSEKLSVKARFDANVLLDNMVRYQHVLTAITYLPIMEITSSLSKYLQTSGPDFIN